MLVIGDKQVAALERDRHEQFLKRLHAHLLSLGHPREAIGPEDDPLQMVDQGAEEAARHGLQTERAVATYVTLCVQYGPGLESLKPRSWFNLLERDAAEPPEPEWIDRVCRDIDAFLQADQDRAEGIDPTPKYEHDEPISLPA